MSEHSFIKRRWKLLLNILTLIALAGLVYALRDQLSETIDNLFRVHAWALLLLIPIQLLNYDAQTRLYRSLFRLVGANYSYKKLYKTSLELNFVNQVFPSGGVSGISYFGMRMRSSGENMTASKATLVQLVKLGLLFLSFEVLLLFGVLLLTAAGKANNFTLLLAGSLSTLMVVGTLLFAFIIGSRQRIDATFTTLFVFMNKLIHFVRPNHPETINLDKVRVAFDDVHSSYMKISERLSELRRPFLYALMANSMEILAVYVVYVAFGNVVNLGAVILAYAVANFAGLVSVMPGGVGVYEALMTAVLVAAGVPAALSLPVTVMYRVLNTLIQLPPGYYFYHKTLHAKDSG